MEEYEIPLSVAEKYRVSETEPDMLAIGLKKMQQRIMYVVGLGIVE